MKKSLFATGFVLLAAMTVCAQEEPKVEVGFNYSFVRVNSTGTRTINDPRVPGRTVTFEIPAFSANGGIASFSYNFNEHWGAVAEVGGFHNGNISDIHIDNTWIPFLFGPRYSFKKRSSGVAPSVHALFGGTHRSASVFLPPIAVPAQNGTTTTYPGTRLEHDDTGFSMALGGSLDIKLNKTIAIRPIELDYYLVRLDSTVAGGFDNFNHNNLRYQAGIVFRFGY
jgi:Outer membrane protein beta-barrel domain